MTPLRFLAPVALAVLIASPLGLPVAGARAQSDGEAASETRPPEPELKAPYEDELLRLAEVLGSVHYLNALCDPKAPPVWRERMSELILTEKPAADLEQRLIARFNLGYEAYSISYRSCTRSARVALGRYVDEGATLARNIAERYGS